MMRRTCSWCHELNDVSRGPTTCRGCGHRADLSRLECDCSQCSRSHGSNPPGYDEQPEDAAEIASEGEPDFDGETW